MTHRKDISTPTWVDQISEDVIVKDAEDTSWYLGGYNGVPTRFHGEGKYINAYDTGYHRKFHDDTSLRSRSSLSSRHRRNTCCLIIFLVFAALLVAIGIGLMVYYLLRPDGTKYQARIANGSLPLLNVPYTQDMMDPNSESFKKIQTSLCKEFDTSFRKSAYADQYEYCQIESLRLDVTPLPCACSNITSPLRSSNVRAYINFGFGDEMYKEDIQKIIEDQIRRIYGIDYDVLMLDDYVIDIASHMVTTTLKPLTPDPGVRASLTIWVYNMTYTSDLADSSSDNFQNLAKPFCNDLRRIFLLSSLQSRYYSCQVKEFREDPDIVNTDVWFTGRDVFGLQTSVKKIILDNARVVNVSNTSRKIIGTLLITPKSGNDSNVTITIPVNPETTISPTPSTRPPKWKDGMPYVETVLNFTGVDYNASLWDTSSYFFKTHANKFCKDLERMILQSSWKRDFYDCSLVNIYPPAVGRLHPTLRTVIHINSNVRTPDDLIDIIKTYGDKYIFPGNLETYRVGDLYIILKDGRFDIYSSSYGTHTTIEYPKTTATLMPSIFTTFSYSSPTMTSGDTTKPPVSTIVIVYNATAAFIESQLIDFTYTTDLQDTTSNRFMSLEKAFCDDIDRFFKSSTLHMYYRNCKITGFTSDPKLSFVLQFTSPSGNHLQTTVPSVLIQKAPKAEIRQMTVLKIGGLNLLYQQIGFTVSVTNFTFDSTPTISPTGTIVVPSTRIPIIYTAVLLNVFCDVAMDVSGGLQNKNSQVFLRLQRNFCQEIDRLFALESTTADSYLDCYITEFSSDASTINFHTIFGIKPTDSFGQAAVNLIHRLANKVMFQQIERLDIGGVVVEKDSCSANIYPVNYTHPQTTLFPTLTPTSQVILPTIGPDHCLRNSCANGGTCVDEPSSYSCLCVLGFSGRDCETVVPVDGGWSQWSTWTTCTATCGGGKQDRLRFCSNPAPKHDGKLCSGNPIEARDCNTQLCPDIDECQIMPDACENGGTCRNTLVGYDCDCYPGYIGDRCETVVDRCASNPCKNGASCTGSQTKLCVCTSGWSGDTCEDDEDECSRVPNICKFNGTCINEFGSFKCDCVPGRKGTTCNEGIDECITISPCQNNARCLDTDYSYTCVCKNGWIGKNCTEDDDECSRDICENGGTCRNTVGSFECTCPSGWTGPTCDLRYNECKGVNPCLNDGLCVDTTTDFQCLCKPEYTGKFCETDVDECKKDSTICNGHGVCENLVGGFECICELEWEGERCDIDHNECSDVDLGQLCFNNGECINQWGSYKCNCAKGWTGVDCMTDINECADTPSICLHNGTCTDTDGGYTCKCSSGWTGDRCQIDVNECNTTFPCQNNATCTNKVGSFLCMCTSGWKGLLCTIDRNECVETPGICRNGGTCYDEEGDYRCVCPAGRGGKNCDYSTDPCNDIVCAHGGTCYIDSNGDAKCDCTALFQGDRCEEDFDECTLNPCSENGTCQNLPGTFYCDCDVGYIGDYCDIDEDECNYYPCVNGVCINTPGSYHCDCPGWTGPYCNIDISECSLLKNPCNGNGRCQETPGSYRCFCFFGYEGQFCQNDVNECKEEDLCKNGGVCWNLPGGYMCNCTQYWTGAFCDIDLNECTTLSAPCLNGGTCKNRDLGYDCTCPSQWRGLTCNEDVDECKESPGLCQNGAKCMNVPGYFRCNCTDGYMGEYCEIDKDECSTTKPCMNGATCTNFRGGYECKCAMGFQGKNCDKDIDECNATTALCKNGGTCVNGPGSFRCDCINGYMGEYCEIDKNECITTKPCMNGATCKNIPGSYDCICAMGFEGLNCEKDINECLDDPCKNGATCLNSPPGDYRCDCVDGWTGKNCDIEVERCPDCVNGGTCVEENGDFRCMCPSGWKGDVCEEDINECVPKPGRCMNGATCSNEQGDYKCDCVLGYGGKNCETDLDDCMPNPCLFGGTCVDGINSFTCQCPPGRIGDNCEGDKDECKTVPSLCQNGATCSNTIGSFDCECPDNWQGNLCDTDRNECSTVTCMHGGICNNTIGSFNCENCDQGWEDQLCDKDKNECPTVQCMNGGTCVNTEGSYFCDGCDSGWEGQLCEKDINECPTVKCMHGGTCVNTMGSYYCGDCDDGWEGQLCDKDKNECPTIQCLHGGTCVNTDGSFYCANCDEGWQGKLCDTDKNECQNVTCVHGGTCVNTDGSFSCENCDAGWTGQFCEEDIDECNISMGSDMPCKNGASCLNLEGSFECICKTGYQGTDCSKDKDECSLTPPVCENGATCINTIGFYTCECTDFWKGDRCNIDVDECDEFGSLACYDNGVCTNTIGGYVCNCSAEYTGKRCDEDKNECAITPPICLNGATCNNYFGSYDCDCDTGFEGLNCGTNIDECSLGVCLNAVSCEDTIGSYTCTCIPGWTGPNCDTDINECNDNLCMNGATCSNNEGSVECICAAGWEGIVCDKDINECLVTGICKNGATCNNKDGGYSCICASGWQGLNCTVDINECLAVDICKNGATCNNIDGSYDCICSPGWEGQNCEKDKDECVTVDICENGATCANTDGSYTCTCATGWEGKNCGIDINECPDVCENGGLCRNTPGSFNCTCIGDWTGPTCALVGGKTFELDFETVGLTITPELLNRQSDQFIRKQTLLCDDIGFFVVTNYNEVYESCRIKSFVDNPAGFTLQLTFDVDQSDDLGSNIYDLLFERRKKERYGDVYGIPVGDMIVKHSDFISTMVTMTKRLVNFTFTDALNNENSLSFQRYENAFCTQVNQLMTLSASANLFPDFIECDVLGFSYDPSSGETSVDFEFEFEGTKDVARITTNFDEYLNSNLSMVRFDRHEAVMFGDFYIYVRDLPNFTKVPLSYQLLDVMWEQDLGNNQSTLFMDKSGPFCQAMSDLIKQRSQYAGTFDQCSVQSYSDTDFVTVNFTMDYFEVLDIPMIQSEISNIIYNFTQSERYNNYVGYRVEDLILYDSIATYYKVPYDGWIANFTFNLFDYSSYKPTLMNSSSEDFKEKQKAFCDGDLVNNFQGMNPEILASQYYGSRLLRCFVHSYTFDDLSLTDKLTSTVSFLFLGIEPIFGEELKDIIRNNFVNIAVGTEEDYYFIGYDLVLIRGTDEIKVNISDYVVDTTTTTPMPEIVDTLPMRFPLLNFTFNEDYLDSSSALYKSHQELFCYNMSVLLGKGDNELPRFGGCGNMNFTTEGGTPYLTFDLAFVDKIQDAQSTVNLILQVIREKAKRDNIVPTEQNPDVTVAIVIGPFLVYQDLLQPQKTNPNLFSSTPPPPV